jgi:LETM1 and EF-hand domain-containing protein 1, mitochondrial
MLQKEEEARRAKKELEERLRHEEEARTVESMLPDSEVRFTM